MFWKLACAGVMFAALNANAAVTQFSFSGSDQNGVGNNGKTAIVDLVNSSTSFDLVGTLDLNGTLQTNQNLGYVFGLYNSGVLVKGLSDFTASSGDVYKFNFTNLASGDYTLRFDIRGGGNYQLTGSITPLSTVVTPVPEPESMALMLVGLGAIVARRYKKA
jgi:hypothetical protein